jgi:hypothetical protein
MGITVPAILRRLPGWLCWRFEQHEGETKARKVPYYVSGIRRHGKQGSPQDRAALATFMEARDAAATKGYDGIGIAMLPDFGLTALDFDACLDADGHAPPEIIAAIVSTYAEYSPSNRGIRAFVMGNLGNHKSHADPATGRYGIETFASTGFVTVTGRVLPGVELCGYEDTIGEPTDALKALCASRFGDNRPGQLPPDEDDPFPNFAPKLHLSVDTMESMLEALDPDMGRDDWIRVGMALHHETEGDDTGFEIWDEWSSGGGKYPGADELRYQWESFNRPSSRRPVTAATLKMLAKAAGWADRADKTPIPETPAGPAQVGAKPRFGVVTAEDLAARPTPPWLIKNVLPKADLGIVFGASGSGKSFLALDLGAAVARGADWRGCRVKPGRVVVIAAEGGGGVGKRLKAYAQHSGTPIGDLNVGVIPAAPNFMERDDIKDVVTAIRASGGADLVIVDTFAQVTPGANENAGEDMGLALRHAQVLHDALGAMILLVHHSGKDATRGARGWSGIKAAADVEIEVTRHESGQRDLRISKMKDGEDGLAWGFGLTVVPLGRDADGDEITSCVVVPADLPVTGLEEAPSERVALKRFGRVAAHVLDMIELIDPSVQSMALEEFVSRCVDGMPTSEPGKRDTRRQHVLRAVNQLTKGEEAALSVKHGRVLFCK